MLPKVKFEVKPLEKYIDVMYYFLNPNKNSWNWSKGIFREYPLLQQKLNLIKVKNERNKIIYEFFKEIEEKKKQKLEIKKKEFQKSWDKINDKALKTLSEVVEIEWPKKDKIITGYVTLNPLCPRWIEQRIFDLFYKFNMKEMKLTSLHEILHFIYFEKWKEVFPKANEKEFDGPYLAWKLSEMVPRIILSDKRIQNILEHKPPVYREYTRLEIKNKPLLDYLQEFYDNKKDFTDFLEKSQKFIKRHEKEIDKKTGMI
ncbi:MAG: hypothetical protein Q8N63_02220 [Nanoarchaeota archaeon]|nr:hypothetical protein [Nanoarchaeota archaeon]